MTEPAPKKPSPAKLRDAFVADLAAVWVSAQSRLAAEQPYLFALYGVEGGPASFMPQVLTETGLNRVAQKYIDKKIYETVDEARTNLRFSVADSPHFDDFEDKLATVEALWSSYADTIDMDDGYKILAKAAIAAFKLLDERRLFGTGESRGKLILAIITEDTGDDWSLKSVKQCNPRAVYEGYKKATEPDGPYQNSCSISFAPDGCSLFAERTRTDPAAKPGSPNEFIHEVVCYDVDGLTLRTRWAIPSHAREVCSAPDGKSVFVLSVDYEGSKATSTVARLDAATGSVLNTTEHENLEAAALAVSSDGTLIAVGTHRKKVAILNERLIRHFTIDLQDTAQGLVFLRTTGELLVGGKRSITRVNPHTAEVLGSVPHPGFHLSVTADESLLATSRLFQREEAGDSIFGIRLLSLPDLRLVREVHPPQERATRAALSSDGRLLAMEIHPLEGYLYRRHVIDLKTDAILFNQKIRGHNQSRFSPAGYILATTTDHRSPREPVQLHAIDLP